MVPEQRSPFDNLVAKSAAVQSYWAAFCRRSGIAETTAYQAFYFGDSAELAHELLELVLRGDKRATASLLWSWQRYPALESVVGAYSVVCEFDGTPRGVIRTSSIDVRAFEDVDAEFARDEGEGDRTLEYWRSAHWDYFSGECAALGKEPSRQMPIVMERFELSWRG